MAVMIFQLPGIPSKLRRICPLLVLAALFLLPRVASAIHGETDRGIAHVTENDIVQSIELIYNCEYEKAEKLLENTTTLRPEDPKGYFYLAMVSWSRLASGFWTPDVVKEYGNRIDRAISVARERIERGNADSFTYFYLGGALGFKGRFQLMQREWVSSFFLALDAIEALKTCRNMDILNRDVLFGLGIFDYYTARLSGALRFLTYFLLHRGDKKEGLRKLHLAADDAIYSAIEAKSVLLHIYLFLEYDYPKALLLARDLSSKFGNNPRFKFLEGVSCILLDKDSEYAATVASLRERGIREDSRQVASPWSNIAFYLEASDDLFHGRFEPARSKLNYILSRADPRSDPAMSVWPLLKIGMSHDIEGDREKATGYYRRILDLENGAGAQFLAEKYLDKPAVKRDPFLGY